MTGARSVPCRPMPRAAASFSSTSTERSSPTAARRARRSRTALARRSTDFDGDLRRYDFSGRTDPQIADDGSARCRLGRRGDRRRSSPISGEHYLGRPRAQRARTRARARRHPRAARRAARRRAADAGTAHRQHRAGRAAQARAIALNDYFPFGAFGSDSPRREELPPIAVERAATSRRTSISAARDVVIIGDSIYDVRCGVPHGATTIAIASGKTTAETLRAENPTHFFESAEDTDALLEAILASP